MRLIITIEKTVADTTTGQSLTAALKALILTHHPDAIVRSTVLVTLEPPEVPNP